jgi:phosphoenolpyruvate-protein kinase (PTS system EI component)
MKTEEVKMQSEKKSMSMEIFDKEVLKLNKQVKRYKSQYEKLRKLYQEEINRKEPLIPDARQQIFNDQMGQLVNRIFRQQEEIALLRELNAMLKAEMFNLYGCVVCHDSGLRG